MLFHTSTRRRPAHFSRGCLILASLSASLAAAVCATGALAAQVAPSRWQAVAHALGVAGEVRGEVFRVEFARAVGPVWLRGARLGPATFEPPWVAFRQQGDLGLMIGRLLLPAARASVAAGKLARARLEVTGVVDPLPGSTPALAAIYFRGLGDPARMAARLHRALGSTLRPPPHERADAGRLDVAGIDRVLGRRGKPESGELVFHATRAETVKCCGLENDPLLVFTGVALGSATGLDSRIVFEGNRARATVAGRLAVRHAEAGSVERALAVFGIQTVCLTESFPDEQPRVLFLRFFGKGKPLELAQGIRAALERTRLQPLPPSGKP
jgi:hypothetical protein